MTLVSTPTLTEPAPASEAAVSPAPTPAVLDRSCRWPVLALFGTAAFWLAVGTILGVISAIKAHAPGFLAGAAWLTYGRVYPASLNALVYGFILPGGLGVGLWMLSRLGRNLLQGPRVITAAAAFWNVGLIVGLVSIFAGASTGYEWLEMPGSALPVLFCAYVLVAGWAVVTLHFRRERTMYVSQWLVLVALLWFPWAFSTAALLLVYFPVRGVMQAVVNGWFANSLFEMCVAPFGLAAIFYFIPKLLGRPLYSRGLALYGFWLWVLLAGWGGVRPGAPVPNWISSVGATARLFLLVAAFAFAWNWSRTAVGIRISSKPDWALRFISVGAASYVLAALLETLAAFPMMADVTVFTLFRPGINQLKIFGFMGMVLSGGIYYVAPRLTGVEWPAPPLIRVHFWCAMLGLVLTVIPLLVGGVVQGVGMNNPTVDYLRVVRSTLPFLGTTTLGMVLLCASSLLLLVHSGRLLSVNCPCQALPFWPRKALPSSPKTRGGGKR
jgi:cytochrome c oxidase cbb3-type subunit I